MALVGPGTQQEIASDIRPLLEGVSEYEYVTILNPLSDDFAIRVAQDVPVNLPITIRGKTAVTQSGHDVVQGYGLDLKNPDFQGKRHISNDTIIKSGQTINLKGNEAQVAVRQIVNELMQREGNGKLLSDPTLRQQAEERVIITKGTIQSLMDSTLRSERSQLDEAINKSNEVNYGGAEAFPGLREKSAEANRRIAESNPELGNIGTDSPRRVGRPKKSDSQ